MFNVSGASLLDTVQCCAEISAIGGDAGSMEEVAGRVVRLFHERLVGAGMARCCALARFYKVHPAGELDEPRRRFAAALAGGAIPPETPCLTLLATAGDDPAWCSPARSAGHLAVPLPSAEVVARMPMVARLIAQLGLQPGAVLAPEPDLVDELARRTLDVFHIPEARGSPFIPAQRDFVEPQGIRSVVGFGGVLPTGSLFAVILFSRAPIPEAMRATFRTVALAVKLALLPVAPRPTFAAEAARGAPLPAPSAEAECAAHRARIAALEASLAEQTRALVEQAAALELLVRRREQEVDEALSRLEGTVRALSAPVIEVWEGVLTVPLVGAVDARTGAEIAERLLAAITRTQSRAVILDATGLAAVDEPTVAWIARVLQAARLLGARCMLTGLGPLSAQRLAEAGADLGGVATLRSLKEGLRACLGRAGAPSQGRPAPV